MENINRWLRVVVALLTIILAGCAITQMTSQVNTELRGRSFSKVLVHGNFQNLKHRQLAEDKLCTDLTRIAGCKCLRSSKVFFPGQEYSAEQIANRLTELEIDGILTLQPTGKGTSSTYIPQITRTTGSATVIGNTVKGSSTTRTSGGYNISKPWANYEVILWSITDGKVAWYATAESGGNAFAGWDDLIRSASSKAVSKLVSDGALMFREQKASNLSLALTPEAEMAEVKKVYLRGEYDKAIQKLQNLMIFVKQVELIENQHEMLANAFLLLGSCYLKKGYAHIAEVMFKRGLEYYPFIEINKEIYDTDVVRTFEKIKEKKKEKKINKKEQIQVPIKKEIIEKHKKSYLKGFKIRVIKEGAVLRLKPNEEALIIKKLPIGGLLETLESIGEWTKIILPPDKDGIFVTGYIHNSFIEFETKPEKIITMPEKKY